MGTSHDHDRTYRALLVDDEADLRYLARVALELDGRWLVVGEASDGAAAVRLARESRPDVVLLDLEMPWLNGAEALPEIRMASPASVVVVWTSQPEGSRANSAKQLGAAVVLGKNSVSASSLPEALVEAFRSARGFPPKKTAPQPSQPVMRPPLPRRRAPAYHLAVAAAAVVLVAGATGATSPAAMRVAFAAASDVIDVLPWPRSSSDQPSRQVGQGSPAGRGDLPGETPAVEKPDEPATQSSTPVPETQQEPYNGAPLPALPQPQPPGQTIPELRPGLPTPPVTVDRQPEERPSPPVTAAIPDVASDAVRPPVITGSRTALPVTSGRSGADTDANSQPVHP